MKRLSAILMSLCLGAQLFAAVPLSQEEKMEWWNEAKFGMFVHRGPYCLYGGVTNYYLCGYECPSDGVLALEGRVPVRKAAMLHRLDLAFYRIKPERAKMSYWYDFWSK